MADIGGRHTQAGMSYAGPISYVGSYLGFVSYAGKAKPAYYGIPESAGIPASIGGCRSYAGGPWSKRRSSSRRYADVQCSGSSPNPARGGIATVSRRQIVRRRMPACLPGVQLRAQSSATGAGGGWSSTTPVPEEMALCHYTHYTL